MHVEAGARQLTAPADGLGAMTRIAGVFEASDIELDDLGLKRPSLDDVFLHLTGHRAEDRPPTRPRGGRMTTSTEPTATAAPGRLERPEIRDTGLCGSRSRSSGAT